MMENIIIGTVSGIIASFIVLVAQFISDYNTRKRIEKHHIYEFESFEIGECTPPEYARESLNIGHTKVKMTFPFDIREVSVYIKDNLIYFDRNVPAESPIYIVCDASAMSQEDEEIAFTVKCTTNTFEKREYDYIRIYTAIEKCIGYALKLRTQHFTITL